MKNETKQWFGFAEENKTAACVLLAQGLFNASLQNVQQAVEKYLKALLVEKEGKITKTHSITELARLLSAENIKNALTDEDCDLIDSIYLPSKYPLGNSLPDYLPDKQLCERCISIADLVAVFVKGILHE